MKQADTASSNDEANRSTIGPSPSEWPTARWIRSAAGFQNNSLMQDMKKVGPNLKEIRLKLNRTGSPSG